MAISIPKINYSCRIGYIIYMKRSTRRLLLLITALPFIVLLIGLIYMELMKYVEGTPRDFWPSIEWAAETLTTTGYGTDSHWESPLLIGFVIFVQFMGVFLVFMLFPIYVIPFFEERFETRLPNKLPVGDGERYILVYRYSSSVFTLIEELTRHKHRTVIIEKDEVTARRLHDEGMEVVHLRNPLDELSMDEIRHARVIVANGSDHENATLLLIAREKGFKGELYARVDDPLHSQPLVAWGATAIYTPIHELSMELAARASRRIRSAILGIQQLGEHLGVTELRIHQSSPLVGKRLEQTELRKRHGVTILGKWRDGQFVPKPYDISPLAAGDIIVIAGPLESLEGLSRLAIPLTNQGPIIIAGYGDVGRKVQQMLAEAGEDTLVIDQQPLDGVDIVGNVLDQKVLEHTAVKNARAVVVTLSHDSACLFAAMVVRNVASEVPLIARVNRVQAIPRLYHIGVDFALSIGQVAGQRLARLILGEEYISLEHNLKMIAISSTKLSGQRPQEVCSNKQSDCQIVAIERDDKLIVELDDNVEIAENDRIYLVGPQQSIDECHLRYQDT